DRPALRDLNVDGRSVRDHFGLADLDSLRDRLGHHLHHGAVVRLHLIISDALVDRTARNAIDFLDRNANRLLNRIEFRSHALHVARFGTELNRRTHHLPLLIGARRDRLVTHANGRSTALAATAAAATVPTGMTARNDRHIGCCWNWLPHRAQLWFDSL